MTGGLLIRSGRQTAIATAGRHCVEVVVPDGEVIESGRPAPEGGTQTSLDIVRSGVEAILSRSVRTARRAGRVHRLEPAAQVGSSSASFSMRESMLGLSA